MPNAIAAQPNPPPPAGSLRQRLQRYATSMATENFMAEATIGAMRALIKTPEAKQEIFLLRSQLREASPQEIISALAELSIHYWVPTMSNDPEEEERLNTLKFQHFCCDLKGVSPRGVIDACIAWRRSDHEFFPKPGQLLALCRDDIRRRVADLRGLDRLEALRDGNQSQLEDGARGRPLRPIGEILRAHGRAVGGDSSS